jgi:hypothetical protein
MQRQSRKVTKAAKVVDQDAEARVSKGLVSKVKLAENLRLKPGFVRTLKRPVNCSAANHAKRTWLSADFVGKTAPPLGREALCEESLRRKGARLFGPNADLTVRVSKPLLNSKFDEMYGW